MWIDFIGAPLDLKSHGILFSLGLFLHKTEDSLKNALILAVF